MKVAYLVVAHKNPQLLSRFIRTLSCENSTFFIHIDLKSNIQPFYRLARDNVFLSRERLPVYWGEFSQVKAVLLLLRQALEQPQSYDYFLLSTGSDYPLRSRAYIHRFLEENRGMEFISMVKMPNEAAGQPITKINTMRFPSQHPFRRFGMRVLAKMGWAQRDYRRYLCGLEPYSGSGWWTLTRDACQYISDFVRHNKEVVEYFENTFTPDEMFFHTILGNSPFLSRSRRNFLYDDWSALGKHPAMIDNGHIALFEKQEKICLNDAYGSDELLFARKFSDDQLEIVERVDEMIARRDTL